MAHPMARDLPAPIDGVSPAPRNVGHPDVAALLDALGFPPLPSCAPTCPACTSTPASTDPRRNS